MLNTKYNEFLQPVEDSSVFPLDAVFYIFVLRLLCSFQHIFLLNFFSLCATDNSSVQLVSLLDFLCLFPMLHLCLFSLFLCEADDKTEMKMM